ncbi:S9 family peptidase [Priestia taiwanensis]|uniref:Peptidase S9 n=1 Tax=Priestia taiwanensis TaxID=1347902 RepID=A0A917ATE8_9BACI|nr:S9 family peptidase [Priestia taiwanensis]MBM7363257.1 esterase/lipase [Priestia taiwanensis]GGE68934.1 peptidase S9 [Priestia taiwanensis]
MIDFPNHDAEQFFQNYDINGFAVSKDEKRLVFSSNMNGKPNIWAMDIPNMYPYPLTYCNQTSSFIKFDSDGKFILTAFDHEGDENYHIHALRPEGGKPFPLLPINNKEDKQYFTHLSEDGERMYYTTNRENELYMNARCYHLKTKQDELIHTGTETTTTLLAVSQDEKTFIIQKDFSATYSLCYVLRDVELICLTPASEKEYVTRLCHFVDNDTVLFVTDYEADFPYVASFHIPTKEFKVVQTFEKEEAVGIYVQRETNSCYVLTHKGVEDRLYHVSIETGVCTCISLPVNMVYDLHVADSGNIYVLGQSAIIPANIYVMGHDRKEWKRLTNNSVLGLEKESLSNPETITYASYDDLEIEALLFKPKGDVANGYTILWPHGGPQWAERKQYMGFFQYMVGLGYTVFAPNFRGSTCYGSIFTKMVERDWGGGPRLDCIAGLEWLIEQGIAERDKLFVVGASFGGYMALLLAGRHAEYFRATVDIFGPSDLFTAIEGVPEHWKPMLDRMIGHPVRDKEKLMEDSPITYLDAMVKPMFIIQGANDARVPQAESDRIYHALKEKDRDVEYMLLKDEGHGFSKKENEIAVYRRIAEFLAKHQVKEVRV